MNSSIPRIRARLLTGFGASMVAALFVAGVAFYSVRDLIAFRTEIAQTKAENLADVEAARSLFRQASSDARAYFLTKNPSFLEHSRQFHKELLDKLDELNASAVTPRGRSLVQKVGTLAKEHSALVEEGAKNYGRRQEFSEYFEKEIHPTGNTLRNTLAELITVKKEKVLTAYSHAHEAITTSSILIVVVATIAIILSVILAFIVSHTLTKLYSEISVLAQKREEALALLGTWLEASPAGLSFLDSSLRFVRTNKKFAESFGLSVEDLLGRSISEALPFRYAQVVDRARSALTKEEAIIDASSTIDPSFLTSYYPVFAGSPAKSVGVGIILVDVTEIRKMEQELMRLSEDLKRSNQDLEQFASIAAHDLREPLRTIRSFLTLLEMKCAPLLDKEAEDYMHFATDGAKRLDDLIQALLHYSHAGEYKLRRETLQTKQIVQSVLLNLNSTVIEKAAQITVGEMPNIQGDPLLVEQLFQNLIGNALKYCKDGPPQVEISAIPGETEIEFLVRDQGIGFPPEAADGIFEIFRRLHTRSEFSGTGIGLAVCKRIVLRHGGRIWAESQPGAGSTFHFTIPKLTSHEVDETEYSHQVCQRHL